MAAGAVSGIRPVAFYLPQFHPTPENDRFWGAGFTEWTNTARARALFPGHRQPHLPADLGFYDLRSPQARAAQSDLAQQYGVTAFAYWHYWFGGGRRILERPFAEVLASGVPSVQFCLAWANQSWTGVWHGDPGRVLIQQTYGGPQDYRAHFESVLPAFRDERYLRVDGKPVFYIFRPEELPHRHLFIDLWQQLAVQNGLPGLYLVAEVSDLLGRHPVYSDFAADGFDAAVHMRVPAQVTKAAEQRNRWARKVLRWPETYAYSADWAYLSAGRDDLMPCVYPNWDNTPRSGRDGLVITGSRPDMFRRLVAGAAASTLPRPAQERLLWVKSWNEWAEGNYLEPDLEFGHGWLEALRDGVADASGSA
ncbi:glycoside hydrolase family 99-like domain-containing protein [Branchiibius cervicis]|uniref:Glycoside hydrolase family 99-like domain-containing protein n=1 Tax=Branchiibius cervicis TaxID=908252 RepID=A0ABW2AVG4_9MICO